MSQASQKRNQKLDFYPQSTALSQTQDLADNKKAAFQHVPEYYDMPTNDSKFGLSSSSGSRNVVSANKT